MLTMSQGTPPKSAILDHSDLIDVAKAIFHVSSKRPAIIKGKRVYFSFIPGGDQTGAPGNAFVTSTTVAFYAGDRTNSFLSNITFFPLSHLQRPFWLYTAIQSVDDRQ